MRKPSKIRNNYLPEAAFWLKNKNIPRMVTVNLTRKCNQHCVYCELGSMPQPDGKEGLTVSDLKWIIDEMTDGGIRKLALCGGEPFLFSGIMEVIGYATEKNIRCAVTSNGMTIHQLNEQELKLLKASETVVHISIDSFDASIQNLTRGHRKALTNPLESLQRLSAHGIPVTLLTAISRYNYRDLYSSAEKAVHRGIREIIYQPIIAFSNYPEQEALNHKKDLNVPVSGIPDLLDQLRRIEQLERHHPLNTNIWRIKPWIGEYLHSMENGSRDPFYSRVLPHFYCREVEAVIDISYDGGIQPCGLQPAGIFLRNHKNENLVELWREATASLMCYLNRGRFPESCSGCCHKFSRNMIASAIKYPVQNRAVLGALIVAMGRRMAIRLKRYPTTDL